MYGDTDGGPATQELGIWLPHPKGRGRLRQDGPEHCPSASVMGVAPANCMCVPNPDCFCLHTCPIPAGRRDDEQGWYPMVELLSWFPPIHKPTHCGHNLHTSHGERTEAQSTKRGSANRGLTLVPGPQESRVQGSVQSTPPRGLRVSAQVGLEVLLILTVPS